MHTLHCSYSGSNKINTTRAQQGVHRPCCFSFSRRTQALRWCTRVSCSKQTKCGTYAYISFIFSSAFTVSEQGDDAHVEHAEIRMEASDRCWVQQYTYEVSDILKKAPLFPRILYYFLGRTHTRGQTVGYYMLKGYFQ